MADDHPMGDGSGTLATREHGEPFGSDEAPPADDEPSAFPQSSWTDVANMVYFAGAAAGFLETVRDFIPPPEGEPDDHQALRSGFPRDYGAAKAVTKAGWLCEAIRYAQGAMGWSSLSEDAYLGFRWVHNLATALISRWGFGRLLGDGDNDSALWEFAAEYNFSIGEGRPLLDPDRFWIADDERDALARAVGMVKAAIPEAIQLAHMLEGSPPPPEVIRDAFGGEPLSWILDGQSNFIPSIDLPGIPAAPPSPPAPPSGIVEVRRLDGLGVERIDLGTHRARFPIFGFEDDPEDNPDDRLLVLYLMPDGRWIELSNDPDPADGSREDHFLEVGPIRATRTFLRWMDGELPPELEPFRGPALALDATNRPTDDDADGQPPEASRPEAEPSAPSGTTGEPEALAESETSDEDRLAIELRRRSWGKPARLVEHMRGRDSREALEIADLVHDHRDTAMKTIADNCRRTTAVAEELAIPIRYFYRSDRVFKERPEA